MRHASRRGVLAALAAGPAWPGAAKAQQSQPIRLVVPFPTGGGTDSVARTLQPHLQALLGAPVAVENRAGRAGATATAHVVRSPPDGRTFLLAYDTLVVNPALQPELPYDAERDLEPVLKLGTLPQLLMVPASRGWRSMPALVEAGRQGIGYLTCATIGAGSLAHLSVALLARAARMRITHVPYRGGGEIDVALRGGEVDMAVSSGTAMRDEIAAGTVLPLAQTGPQRAATHPALPTLVDSGFPGVEATSFWGVLAPARTPLAARQRMEAALRDVLARPDVRTALAGYGLVVAPQGPEEFRVFIAAQIARWRRVVQENAIGVDG